MKISNLLPMSRSTFLAYMASKFSRREDLSTLRTRNQLKLLTILKINSKKSKEGWSKRKLKQKKREDLIEFVKCVIFELMRS